MAYKFSTRRRTERPPRLVGRHFQDYAQELQDWLSKLIFRVEGGIPAGHNGLTPVTVSMGGTASPGTEGAGWMAADALLVVDTEAPSVPLSLGSAAAVGSATTGLSSDAVFDGTRLAAQVRAMVSLRVG